MNLTVVTPLLFSLLSLTKISSWYFFPLVIAVSLVYGATREEQWPAILDQAWRFGAWMAGFLALIFAVLLFLSWSL